MELMFLIAMDEVVCDDQLAIAGDFAIWTAEGVYILSFFILYKWACSGYKTGSVNGATSC